MLSELAITIPQLEFFKQVLLMNVLLFENIMKIPSWLLLPKVLLIRVLLLLVSNVIPVQPLLLTRFESSMLLFVF